MRSLFVCFFIALVTKGSRSQDVAFPESHELASSTNTSSDRTPLFIPTKCPENQLLYPGNQNSDWICDCRPGYLYYPEKSTCYAAYRKGPCAEGQFLVLPTNQVIPKCVNNVCRDDGYVRYKGRCYPLDKAGGPCRPVNEGGGRLGVNLTSYELGCIRDKNSLIPPLCPPNSDRNQNCGDAYK